MNRLLNPSPIRMVRRLGVLATVGALLVTAGCGGGAPSGQTSGAPSSASSASSSVGTGSLTVFAAASLKNTFTAIGTQFESANGAKVTFSFAGSSDLVTQIQQGAPADVFASADAKNMDKATADNLVEGKPVDFASNTLEIAVAPGNPAKIASFADLTQSGLKVVVCAPQVPCGSATQKVETATGIDILPVSEESSVTDVLNKVTSGEADAGLVYKTDVKGAAGKVDGVDFPESAKAVNTYPIAVLAGSKDQELAQKFIELVTSTDGQQVLADAGFGKP